MKCQFASEEILTLKLDHSVQPVTHSSPCPSPQPPDMPQAVAMCSQLLELSWEKLHTGNWKDVALVRGWRWQPGRQQGWK